MISVGGEKLLPSHHIFQYSLFLSFNSLFHSFCQCVTDKKIDIAFDSVPL